MKRICTVIINYKTAKLSINCINSIAGQLDAKIDSVIVVDNHSQGNDLKILKNGLKSFIDSGLVRIIALNENKGFSAGNNAGVAALEAEYYLLANSDTIFRNGAVSEIIKASEKYPDAGIISPRLEWEDGEAQISCFKFQTPIYELIKSAGTGIVTKLFQRYNVPIPVTDVATMPNWTSFACVLIKQEVFQKIGLMDEGYFMYFEDVDFCRRTWDAGFSVVNWPASQVVHLRGKSSPVKEKENKKERLPSYFYKSRSRYYKTFYGNLGLLAANILWTIGRLISLPKEVILSRNRTVPKYQWKDIWQN